MVRLILSKAEESGAGAQSKKNGFTSISVPLAYLRLFRLGDVWANNRRIGADSHLQQVTFAALRIDDSTVEVAPTGLPIIQEDGTSIYPLPFSDFGAHRDHTGAFCARVRVASDMTLVVPCMELVRFYFGASGGLLKRLFSGAHAAKNLFTSARINPETRIANLDLAPGLPGVAASTVGRIAFDRQAQKAMYWIVNSGVAASANGQRYYPRTTFPFIGDTNLTVQGRWINQHGHRVFLAERLLRCTHPFPFQTLFYTSHLDLSTSRKLSRTASEQSSRQNKGGTPSIELREARVASDLQPVAVQTTEEIDCPFPDLLEKHVRRVRAASSRGGRQATPPTQLGTGESSSTSVIREAEITTENLEEEIEETYPEMVEFISNEVSGLSDHTDGGVKLLHPRNEGGLPWEMLFSPASTLVSSVNDTRLEEIWAARLIFDMPRYADSLLVVIRPRVPWSGMLADDNEEVSIFRYRAEDDPQGHELGKLLVRFADMPSKRDESFIPYYVEDMGTPLSSYKFWVFLTGALGWGEHGIPSPEELQRLSQPG